MWPGVLYIVIPRSMTSEVVDTECGDDLVKAPSSEEKKRRELCGAQHVTVYSGVGTPANLHKECSGKSLVMKSLPVADATIESEVNWDIPPMWSK